MRVPIRLGTARRLGLRRPDDGVIYDEIDWSRFGTSMQEIGRNVEAWQKAWVRGLRVSDGS